ncbi:MAG: hypothetical protein A2035_01735 [Nitrospirae bacterium GWA2_42_11]|nr:MAG: hypothetical protein A2035_01735 [Nitrospirae bacterium GWA2_42_11]
MPQTYKNSDFVLRINDDSPEILNVINKYDTYLASLCAGDYSFQIEAVKKVLRFLFSNNYKSIEDLARENYSGNDKLRQKFERVADYLTKLQLRDKKSCSLDLATGTGKSYVIYALAQICLAEGLVDKVLVLCPSLTIEEGLTEKFEELAGRSDLKKIIEELNSVYKNPSIKNSNNHVLDGDICVENIHAVYERTGSSIEDSFKGKGHRVLVINDEAHHIFSPSDTDTKKWLDFLRDEGYGFHYIVNLSGTPYTGDEYFYDIVYRFSIRDAINAGVVKKIDYKFEEGTQRDKGFQDSYKLHENNWKVYGRILKPLTIVVTEKIANCIKVWKELVDFIVEKKGIPFDEAKRKVIWVTSGVPGKDTRDGREIRKIIEHPEKIRKENLQLLKEVDDADNPVEWIVSVSMLTEGWDVKNVFQVVPHENRAFNSKLLIAQVLGRGLRIPYSLKDTNIPVLLKVNNHERWTTQIENLYRDVLEVENGLSWGYDPSRTRYTFPLYNLKYAPVQTTTETKNKPPSDPQSFGFGPQMKVYTTTDRFSESGEHSFEIWTKDNLDIESAASFLHMYLKMKDPAITNRWTPARIKEAFVNELKDKGYDYTFLSKENYINAQKSFGTLMRGLNEENPRLSQRSNDIEETKIEDMTMQTFNEGELKNDGMMFYDHDSLSWFKGDQMAVFSQLVTASRNYEKFCESFQMVGGNQDNLKYLKERITEVDITRFRTPLNIVYVTHEPERKFMKDLFSNIHLFDSFIKNPSRSFYSFPYSYKPETEAKTHVRQDNFNPDFFLKKGDDIIVLEIKKDDDDSKKNKAKYRDGSRHFEVLNKTLEVSGIPQRYYFIFLSPDDYVAFFQSVRDGSYKGWKSSLMNMLEE